MPSDTLRFMRAHVVTAAATVLWIATDRPRGIDTAMLGEAPDPVAWLAAMDAATQEEDGRLGLFDRLHTQLVCQEPVWSLSGPTGDGWVEVVCPWQPSESDPRGFRGWLRAAHLTPGSEVGDAPVAPAPTASPAGSAALAAVAADIGANANAGPAHPAVALARRHLGLPYLWGGTTSLGLDCSGLVHTVWRELGLVVPRDAHDQARYAEPVTVEDARPGDLFFFAQPDAEPHHVGIVTGPGTMIHAPQTGQGIVEEPLSPPRRETLRRAGRLPLPPR